MADPAPDRRSAGPADGTARRRRPLLWPTAENPDPAGRAAELRRDWQARLKPIDEAERAAVDSIVGTVRRRALLERAEIRLLKGLAEGRVDPAMPSLSAFGRHAARIAKDRALAERELDDLWRLRPDPIGAPDLLPERLEWLAGHLRRRAVESAEALAALLEAHLAAPVAAPAGAAATGAPRGAGRSGTGERSAEPAAAPPTAASAPSAAGPASPNGEAASAPRARAEATTPDPGAAAAAATGDPAAPEQGASEPPRPSHPSAAPARSGHEGRAAQDPAARAVAAARGSGPRLPPAAFPRSDWLGSASAMPRLAAALFGPGR